MIYWQILRTDSERNKTRSVREVMQCILMLRLKGVIVLAILTLEIRNKKTNNFWMSRFYFVNQAGTYSILCIFRVSLEQSAIYKKINRS